MVKGESGLKNFSPSFFVRASPIKQIQAYFILYYILMHEFYF